MELNVIGTGSSGNCYLLVNTCGDYLVIDAGVQPKEVLREVNYNLSRCAGVIVSHEHGDHAKYARDFMQYGLNVAISAACSTSLGLPGGHREIIFSHMVSFRMGDFTVLPFSLPHDCDNHGFIIHHPEMGSLMYATDMSSIEVNATGVNHYLVEANYADDILDRNSTEGSVPRFVSERVRRTHMSLSSLSRFFRGADLSDTRSVTLCHLSSKNSDASRFKAEVEEASGITVAVAERGMKRVIF